MSIARDVKHWIMAPIPVSWTFPKSALKKVEDEIAQCEKQTSVEFRVIVERSLPVSYLKRNDSTYDRARVLFGKYGLWDTELNNGILIYLNLSDRAIELFLDRAARKVLSEEELKSIVQNMSKAFSSGDFEGGLITALDKLTDLLKEKFPNDPNAQGLPNDTIVL